MDCTRSKKNLCGLTLGGLVLKKILANELLYLHKVDKALGQYLLFQDARYSFIEIWVK